MSYQVLARKWRPRAFATLVGQEHVQKALTNALESGRIHHAYLFTGTRGVGKTTISRILAKSLNCEQGVSATPCCECPVCLDIDAGRFVDLIEVDAASRTKVEDTREILDNVQYRPSRGRYKVYLIDEVHMLSNSSFNALLKTLEEPPEHVVFFLATTDPQKIPATVLSRCLQFHLKSLEVEQIAQQLETILSAEAIPAETPALTKLAQAADGSMRDGLSLLDQAIAFSNGPIELSAVNAMLGTVDARLVEGLLSALVADDAQNLISVLHEIRRSAPDYSHILEDFIHLLHQIAVYQVTEYLADHDNRSEAVKQFAQEIPREDVQLFYQLALHGRRDLPLAPSLYQGLEMTFLRLLAFRPQPKNFERQERQGPASNRTAEQGKAPATGNISQGDDRSQENRSQEKKTLETAPSAATAETAATASPAIELAANIGAEPKAEAMEFVPAAQPAAFEPKSDPVESAPPVNSEAAIEAIKAQLRPMKSTAQKAEPVATEDKTDVKTEAVAEAALAFAQEEPASSLQETRAEASKVEAPSGAALPEVNEQARMGPVSESHQHEVADSSPAKALGFDTVADFFGSDDALLNKKAASTQPAEVTKNASPKSAGPKSFFDAPEPESFREDLAPELATGSRPEAQPGQNSAPQSEPSQASHLDFQNDFFSTTDTGPAKAAPNGNTTEAEAAPIDSPEFSLTQPSQAPNQVESKGERESAVAEEDHVMVEDNMASTASSGSGYALSELDNERWNQLVQQAEFTGVIAQIAHNSTIKSTSDSALTLQVASDCYHYCNGDRLNKMRDMLKPWVAAQNWQLKAENAQGELADTPLQRQEKALQEKHAAVMAELEADKKLQMLRMHFDLDLKADNITLK